VTDPPSTLRAVIELPIGALRIEAPRPLYVTQHNAMAILGLKPRAFLESLHAARARGVEILTRGRTRMVALDAYVSFLRERSEENSDDGAEALANAAGLRLVRR
jgi:hypothetical protein